MNMSLDLERRKSIFQKLQRQLDKLEKKTAPDNVHKFRTYSRRIETLLEEMVPEPTRNQRKLLKALSRVRRKAGRVRDLDVQVSSLRALRVPQDAARKSRLLIRLTEDRAKKEHKLTKSFDKQTLRELRHRLDRAMDQDGIPPTSDPLKIAMRRFAALSRSQGPLTEKQLHQYRIIGKRARYLGEFAGKNPDSERFVQQLKRMQDAIGDWHDWLKLTERAEKLFEDTHDSALLALLRNVTRAKFHQAVGILVETQESVSIKGSSPSIPTMKLATIEQARPAAA